MKSIMFYYNMINSLKMHCTLANSQPACVNMAVVCPHFLLGKLNRNHRQLLAKNSSNNLCLQF